MPSRPDLEAVRELARQLRVDSIRSVAAAGSGHPTSSLSAADLMAVLFARHLHYDWARPDRPDNDHLIFSKGHASPLLYSLYKAVGVISDQELMETYRRAGSPLQGHPTPVLPWVDVATGSLGQGLPDGVGVALAGKRLDQLDYRVWVLCGDSELAEGSIWEALDKASHYGLDNLTAIVDVNRLGQSGPDRARLGHGDATGAASRRSAAAPWSSTGTTRRRSTTPSSWPSGRSGRRSSWRAPSRARACLRSRTQNGWHGKPLPADVAEQADRGARRRHRPHGRDAAAAVAAGGGQPRRSATPSSCPSTRWA